MNTINLRYAKQSAFPSCEMTAADTANISPYVALRKIK